MKIHLVALAIPVFLFLISIEYVVSKMRKTSVYQLSDFANNISCGVLEQICVLPLQGLLLFNYHYLYRHIALFSIDSRHFYYWVLLWFGVDFCYYWLHRACHRNTFLWVGHSVHHQSEQYNLSVALRQGLLQTLCTWFFYLPLAVIGFPTEMFLIVSGAIMLYQFWIHTQLIKQMRGFELFFNSPSHHRVHHGKNAEYIDKNYGGSLIIWDKLFGTYQKEITPVCYGITEPLNSWNVFYANIKTFDDVHYYGQYLNGWWNKILVFFKPPEWIIKKLNAIHSIPKRKFFLPTVSYPAFYILLNTLFIILATTYYLLNFRSNEIVSWCIFVFIIVTIYLIGMVLNYGYKISVSTIELMRALLVMSICHFLWMSHELISLFVGMFFGAMNRYLFHAALSDRDAPLEISSLH